MTCRVKRNRSISDVLTNNDGILVVFVVGGIYQQKADFNFTDDGAVSSLNCIFD